MAFRADEATVDGYERTKRYLIAREVPEALRAASEEKFRYLVDEYGPVVDAYPTWHPLVRNKPGNTETTPSDRNGYVGLDHTVYLANAFISCPYTDGQEIIDSVEKMPDQHAAAISAERLDVTFYNTGTTAILVRCEWSKMLETGGTIPARLAVPLMLEQELPMWTFAEVAETWETMRPYLLGSPHGQRSSLFVTQETALAMKKIYLGMAETGMFGPMRMG